MADTNANDTLKPMTDADVLPAAATTDFQPAGDSGRFAGAKQTLADNTAKVRAQATDKALNFAEEGKAKATGALAQLSQMLTEAAGQVDEKLGAQYGQYARSAADQVSTFTSSIEAKSVDDLVDDVRGFVRQSPAIAIGAAAAVGFVVARLLTSGLDQRDGA